MNPPAAAPRILCVEDEPEILRDIADEVRDQGFEVLEASNGEDALELILAERPDLVVCDIQMPGMSGIELLTTLRGRADDVGDLPFIFLTAFGDREHLLAGRRAGADDYLVKPVDYDLLIATIRTRLDNSARRGRTFDPIAMFERLPGRQMLLQKLETLREPGQLAVLSIDNPNELIRRLGRRAEDFFARVSQETQADGKTFFFHLQGFDFALLGIGEAEPLEARLAGLTRIDVQERRDARSPSATVTASISTSRVTQSNSGERLLDQLVSAMRLIQSEGGARRLSLEDSALADMREARSLRSRILPALEREEFRLAFQPKIRLSDGQVIGAEALLRWSSPDIGTISPQRLIEISEQAGLLRRISDWVITAAGKAQQRLIANGFPIRLAINIGAPEFDDSLPTRLIDALEAAGGRANMIDIEITETTLIADFEKTRRIAQLLRALGMTMAVDDFGTGYSSLSYIGQLPIDTIKIDRSFVEKIDRDHAHRQIVSTIVELGHRLRMEIVAEGVETEAQRDFLKQIGCDAVQGYLTARPMDIDQLEAFLAQTQKAKDAAS